MAVQTELNPVITTFFNNKIPCTFDDWLDTLVIVASVYDKFDGKEYQRNEIVREFGKMATRNDTTHRDPSDFRDEYGAYGSYLGIFYVEKARDGRLICRTSKAAKRLLCGHDPDPEAFCRLQMALCQYPDGTGIVYAQGMRLQENSAKAKIGQIEKGVLFAPFRTLLRFLLYMNDNEGLRREAYLTYDEIYFLFNHPEVYKNNISAFPEVISELLAMRREKNIPYKASVTFKRNFHILERTGLIRRERNLLRLSFGPEDEIKMKAARTIAGLGAYFGEFSAITGAPDKKREIVKILLSGAWGRYFDGMNLDFDTVSAIITPPESSHAPGPANVAGAARTAAPFSSLQEYRLFRFPGSSRPAQREPDYARARETREKRNVQHREINDILAKKVIALGGTPRDNVFMDLAAKLQEQDFIFEVKTVGAEDALGRIREAVAQLLEYRFRSKSIMLRPALVLLLGRGLPPELAWAYNYLKELGITLCWMDNNKICAKGADRAALGRIPDAYF